MISKTRCFVGPSTFWSTSIGERKKIENTLLHFQEISLKEKIVQFYISNRFLKKEETHDGRLRRRCGIGSAGGSGRVHIANTGRTEKGPPYMTSARFPPSPQNIKVESERESSCTGSIWTLGNGTCNHPHHNFMHHSPIREIFQLLPPCGHHI